MSYIVSLTNCTQHPDICEQRRSDASVALAVTGVLSIMGSIFILVSSMIFSLYKKRAARLVMYLSIADLLQSFATLTSFWWVDGPPTESSNWCQFQGFFFNFSNVASALWSAVIATYVGITVFRQTKPGHVFEMCSHGVWALSLIFTGTGYGLSQTASHYFYGPVAFGVWCWIPSRYVVERMMLHYTWIFLIILYLFIMYIAIAVYLRKNITDDGKSSIIFPQRNMFCLFPLIIILETGQS
eukprot:TRINITY_DN1447_c0_g1_i6.p1 TRINITY_DN1447_c0_g1~~TRINITY_DN1447_c0_g1_i6.p1  ORF type:complete len:241 (-),score=18.18 TRINITY_DN1447_c0_g1_i6:288-1010(-)